jgi:hypothetical protein
MCTVDRARRLELAPPAVSKAVIRRQKIAEDQGFIFGVIGLKVSSLIKERLWLSDISDILLRRSRRSSNISAGSVI